MEKRKNLALCHIGLKELNIYWNGASRCMDVIEGLKNDIIKTLDQSEGADRIRTKIEELNEAIHAGIIESLEFTFRLEVATIERGFVDVDHILDGDNDEF